MMVTPGAELVGSLKTVQDRGYKAWYVLRSPMSMLRFDPQFQQRRDSGTSATFSALKTTALSSTLQ